MFLFFHFFNREHETQDKNNTQQQQHTTTLTQKRRQKHCKEIDTMDDNIDNGVDEDQLEVDAAVPAVDAAETAEQRHLKIRWVLQQKTNLPVQTRNEIDVLIEEFLNTVKSNIDAAVTTADAAEAAEVAEQKHLKMMSVLEQKKKLPVQTDELIEEFLDTVKSNIHGMICSNDLENYHGLDSDRDTEQEVETAIRLFPKVLTTKYIIGLHDDDDEYVESFYPVQLLAFSHRGEPSIRRCNLKAVSFIPLLIRLAIELEIFGIWFGEELGGGLFVQDDGDNNVLQNLMLSDSWNELHNREHHETIDRKYLQVLVQLRRMGVFKIEDIQRYDLLDRLCGDISYFADTRFRFLIEWDPSSLIGHSSLRWLPLHHAAFKSSIRGFGSVFEAGIKYFPNKKGISLLFTEYTFSPTPFEIACENNGYKEVMKVVEDTLIRYSDTPINTTEALIMAAIDENIHLDCVYFLLRREPDILHKLLSSKQVAVTATTIDSSTDEATSNNCDSEKRKRKRGT